MKPSEDPSTLRFVLVPLVSQGGPPRDEVLPVCLPPPLQFASRGGAFQPRVTCRPDHMPTNDRPKIADSVAVCPGSLWL